MRRRNLENKFTYGFEIEGLFSRKLRDSLSMQLSERNFRLEIHGDSSVNIDKDAGDENISYSDGQEFTLGIFPYFGDVLKFLDLFKSPDYEFNRSCGLHVHIMPKALELGLRELTADIGLIKASQKWAFENLCNHIKHERKGSDYCRNYPVAIQNFSLQWRRSSKYHFVRNHPLGTFEFRFFSACTHKVDNVKKFFSFFFDELSKIKPQKNFTSTVSEQTKVQTLEANIESINPRIAENEPLIVNIGDDIYTSLIEQNPLLLNLRNEALQGYERADAMSALPSRSLSFTPHYGHRERGVNGVQYEVARDGSGHIESIRYA